MRLKPITQYGLAIVTLSSSLFAFAEATPPAPLAKNLIIEEGDVYDPDARKQTERHLALEKFSKNFNFDWSQSATISQNKAKVAEIDVFLKKIDDYSKLNKEDQKLAGQLSYQLGTFYTHIARDPNPGIDKLTKAETLLIDKEAKASCYNQLAYAYAQKYSNERYTADKEKALYYTSKVISDFYPNVKNQDVAFAYGIKGRVQKEAHDYSAAQESLKTALDIYESLPNGKEDAYARTRTKLADTLLEQNKEDKAALAMLEESKQYWLKKQDVNQNPYAANNLVSLGQAYLRIGNIKEAQAAIKQAISIYENVYGAGSKQLSLPYELLSQTYQQEGKQKLAAAYIRKAASMGKV